MREVASDGHHKLSYKDYPSCRRPGPGVLTMNTHRDIYILVLNKPTMALATATVPQQIRPLHDES